VVEDARGFLIEECICPALKEIHCAYHISKPEDGSGPIPVIPFRNWSALDNVKHWKLLELKPESFTGLSVPNSCIVKVVVTIY